MRKLILLALLTCLATSWQIFAQETIVQGTVTDASSGEPLVGVNIVLKGTTKGVITDTDGNYTISVPGSDAVLQVSYIGYLTEDIPVGSQTKLDITMTPDLQSLEQVVVIGYGTQKKKELTSAVTNVTSDDFNKGAVSQSPIQLVQGKVAGLAISRNNGGDPNSGVQMQIRGVSTLEGDKAPLVIIDGVPGGDLNTVAPEDIESFSVLRDGSAAAIYGTRGTNGVILITTKQGNTGKTVFEYSSYGYIERFAKVPDVLSADGYRSAADTFGKPIQDFGASTDWFKEITHTPISQVHNFAISGGNENTKFYASVNYRNLQGIVKRSYNDLLNGRLSVTSTGLKDRLTVQTSIAGTMRKYSPTDYNVFQQAFQMNPTLPVFNENGDYAEIEGQQEIINPVMMLYTRDDDQQNMELLANFRVTLEIIKGLKLSTTGAIQRNDWSQGYYEYQNRFYGGAIGSNPYDGVAVRNSNSNTQRTSETTLNYGKLIGGNSINLMAGYSFQDQVFEGFGARNYGFISDDFTYNNLNAGVHLNPFDPTYDWNDVHSTKNSSQLEAFFGRAMWNYQEKYMATVSIRHEGSSKFGTNNKWGNFPAVSAGWRVSEEPFMESVLWLSDLKIRAGYGITGNQGVVSYASLATLRDTLPVLYEGKYYPALYKENNNNPDLKWEKKVETDFGIDIGVFDNRVLASIDVYNRDTRDLLYQYPVGQPQYFAPYYWDNVGKIRNQGVEVTINAVPVKKSDFSWRANFNISYNKNEVVSIAGGHISTDYVDPDEGIIGSPGLTGVRAFRLQNGQPIGNMYGYRYAGLDENGKWLVWDSTGTEKILINDATEEDKAIIGNGLPKVWMGFTNDFSYKNFDLSFLFRGAFGFDILNLQRLFYDNKVLFPKNVLASAVSSPVDDQLVYTDYYIEKGNYIKLDNVTLGYTIPFDKSIITKARIYISGTNLHTFTKYKGMDPELRIEGFVPGMDRRTVYPVTRTFTAGINLTF